MREILFRGKRKDNRNPWIYGHLHKMDGYGTGYTEYGIQVQDIPTSRPWSVSVIPETVGQYTGLTDKNGKKIFEGDIVKYGDTVHNVVFEQRNGTAYFGLVYSPLETLPCGHYQDLRQIEVIGNIHDNPELLKGGTE